MQNPNDHENLQQQEANKLFHSDETLDDMLLYGAIFTAALVFLGLCRQLIIYFFQKRKGMRNTILHQIHSKTVQVCGIHAQLFIKANIDLYPAISRF